MKKKKFKIYEIIFFIVALAIMIFIVFNIFHKTDHCKLAVCNSDSSICYNYYVDKNNNTIITWRGSCKK